MEKISHILEYELGLESYVGRVQVPGTQAFSLYMLLSIYLVLSYSPFTIDGFFLYFLVEK